mmetsp:Transcript_11741/g.27883  ORF Transcript_11741/g.27883 Transcript_11741/m.27883 type:complete len:336 (+) Transcript_11741:154-1161(+)
MLGTSGAEGQSTSLRKTGTIRRRGSCGRRRAGSSASSARSSALSAAPRLRARRPTATATGTGAGARSGAPPTGMEGPCDLRLSSGIRSRRSLWAPRLAPPRLAPRVGRPPLPTRPRTRAGAAPVAALPSTTEDGAARCRAGTTAGAPRCRRPGARRSRRLCWQPKDGPRTPFGARRHRQVHQRRLRVARARAARRRATPAPRRLPIARRVAHRPAATRPQNQAPPRLQAASQSGRRASSRAPLRPRSSGSHRERRAGTICSKVSGRRSRSCGPRSRGPSWARAGRPRRPRPRCRICLRSPPARCSRFRSSTRPQAALLPRTGSAQAALARSSVAS